MKQHDCVIIGDSLSAIHMANELARKDFTVMLVKPDISPVEVYDSPKGAFECDLASGIDLSYYSSRYNSDGLYGFTDNFETLPFPFRMTGSGFDLVEPGNNDDFLRLLTRKFPNHKEAIQRFEHDVSILHDMLYEIQVKTGLNPPFKQMETLHVITQMFPWNYYVIHKASKTSFARFIAKFNLPEEILNLFTLKSSNQLGLDSLDTLSAVELIMRRRHGLTRPKTGWASFKTAMLDKLRENQNATIIGGKRIDLIKSKAGVVTEIYIDERDVHPVDWMIVDETPGLFGVDGAMDKECKFTPLGYYSNSHLDFKLFLGWECEPPKDFPVGINFLCKNYKYPPHAPHVVRVDIMPFNADDSHGLKTRITVRGKYPVERVISSWGDKFDKVEMRKELMSLLDVIDVPTSEPAYAELVLPKNVNDPFKKDEDKPKSITPSDFADQHLNVRVIESSGINNGNMRIAFHSAEKIAYEITRCQRAKKLYKDIAFKPIIVYPGFCETVGIGPKR